MMRMWVYSGRPSEGAALLADEEGFRRNRTGKFVRDDDCIVNWGNIGHIPGRANALILNLPDVLSRAINKKSTFEILAGANISVVPWTSNKAVAKEWLAAGRTVVARKTLTGHEGAGILIVEPGNELVEAPLYTQYIFKVREFRVHATPLGVIDTQQKVRDPQREVISWKVRSYKNGFIFQRKGIESNINRDNLAIQTVRALGLDFGGLDIIEDKQGKLYVLEVNTAPGIEGSTVTKYATELTKLARHYQAHGRPGPGLHVAGGAPVGGNPYKQPAPRVQDRRNVHPGEFVGHRPVKPVQPARDGPEGHRGVVNLNRQRWVA